MPFAGEVSLDCCEVETKGATREDVVRAARQRPRDPHDWYLTLTRGEEEFMDATMEDESTFGVRVFEDGRKCRTGAAIREDLLEPLFLSFYEHDSAWKALCAWEEIPEKPKFSLKDLFKR